MNEFINNNFWLIITVALLSYIGMSKGRNVFCTEKRSDEQNCNRPCKPMMAKDFIYMAVIFGILAVVMMSFVLYRDSEALNYFSFASTLSSIILSVIAIIMTINSERKSDNAKAQLDIAIQSMKQMNEELNGKLEQIKEYSDSIAYQLEEQGDRFKKIEESARDASENSRSAVTEISKINDAMPQLTQSINASQKKEDSGLEKTYENKAMNELNGLVSSLVVNLKKEVKGNNGTDE